jgi:invasion protein IalB
MHVPDRFLRLSGLAAVSALLVLSLADGSLAAEVPRGHTGKLAQQGKAAPAAPPKSAQEQPGEEPAAWAVTCTDQGQKKFTCEMTQSLIDQKSNVQVVLISIKAVATGESKAMLVRFFHGVYLPTGVSIKVDGGPSTPLAFQKSDRLGVYAALPLTDKIVAEMKRGKELRLSVQINQGEPLEVVARLNGFGPAFDRINSMH